MSRSRTRPSFRWTFSSGTGLHWYPQMYYGDMSPADPAAVMLEVTRIYPPEMVHPFYDGACVPADARDGCVSLVSGFRSG